MEPWCWRWRWCLAVMTWRCLYVLRLRRVHLFHTTRHRCVGNGETGLMLRADGGLVVLHWLLQWLLCRRIY